MGSGQLRELTDSRRQGTAEAPLMGNLAFSNIDKSGFISLC